MMPPLNSHTHCQAAQTSRTSQSLSISVSEPTHGRKESTGIQQSCIKAIAGEVVKSRSVHLINFSILYKPFAIFEEVVVQQAQWL